MLGLALRTSAMSWTVDNMMDRTGSSEYSVFELANVCEVIAALGGSCYCMIDVQVAKDKNRCHSAEPRAENLKFSLR